MADTNTDDVVVKIDEEPVPQADIPPDVVSDPAAAELTAQLDALKAEQAADRAAKQAADTRAREAEAATRRAREEIKTVRGEAVDSQLETITTGIEAAKAEANAAEVAYAAAMEGGNFLDAAKAQRKMAAAEAHRVRLEEAQDYVKARQAQVARAPMDEAPERPQDPVEAYIANRTEPTANWLRAHRDYIGDPQKNAKLTAAHWDAVGDGIAVDTPAYFEAVERRLGLRQPEGKTNGVANGAGKRDGGAPVAPVSYTGGSDSTQGGDNVVRLSKNEVLAATDGTHIWNYDDPSGQKKFKKGDPIGKQEFARRKREMMKQGHYDRAYVEQ